VWTALAGSVLPHLIDVPRLRVQHGEGQGVQLHDPSGGAWGPRVCNVHLVINQNTKQSAASPPVTQKKHAEVINPVHVHWTPARCRE
jgi:hypothetical protein